MLYLNKVEISEFRPYGDQFLLELPAPGVTILVGPNGLGKSAFFEALEWCMTGKVDRLERLPDRTKRGPYGRIVEGRTKPFTCRVAMTFGDNALEVARSAQYTVSGEPRGASTASVSGASTILELLKEPGWSLDMDEDSLSTYLRTTHFLAQSTAVRLTSQDPKERWGLLSQLNGAGLLERAQKRLLSRATTAALDDEIATAQQRVSTFQVRLERCLELFESRDALVSQASVAGSLDSDAAAIALRQIVPRHPFPAAQAIDDQLAAARTHLQDAEERLVARISLLESSASLPGRFGASTADLIQAQSQAVEAEKASTTTRAELAKMQVAFDRLLEARAAAEKALSAHEAQEAELRRIRQMLSDLAALDKETEDFAVSALALSSDLATLETNLELSRTKYARTEGLLQEERRLTERRDALSSLLADVQALAARAPDIESVREGLEKRKLSIQQGQRDLALLQEALNEATRTEQDAADRARLARSRADSATQLVAQLAALLTEFDTACPVCQSTFDPGVLRHRADGSAQASSAEVTAAEQILQRTRVASEAARSAVGRATSNLTQAAATLTAEQKSVAEHSVANEDVWRRSLALGQFARDNLSGAIGTELDRVGSTIDELRKQIEKDPALDEIRAEIDEVSGRLVGAREAMHQHRSTVETRAERRRETFQALTRQPQELVASARSTDQQLEDQQGRQLDALQRNVTESRDAANALEMSLTRARNVNEQADRTKALSSARVAAAQEQLQAHHETWRSLSLDGPPAEERLSATLRQAFEEKATLAVQRERLDELGRRLNTWRNQQALAEKQNQVLQLMNEEQVTSEPAIEKQIRRRIEEARQHHGRCVATKRAVERFRNILKDVTSDYFEQVVAPLNVLERAYAKAITVRTPFAVEWATRLAYGTTHLDLQSRVDGGTDIIPAGHVLSEGQLAATAFTQLVSLSTAYGWSRWRALLLDDPVQHNDVLHVSAFVDLLRNCVREQQYQIVLSTHDPSIAEFIGRKLRAVGGIQFKTCWFQGLTELGVRYKVDEG